MTSPSTVMAPAGKPQSNKRATTSPTSWLPPSMLITTSMVWSPPVRMATPSPSTASTTQTQSASQPALLHGIKSDSTSTEISMRGRLGRSVSLSDDGLTVAISGTTQVQIHRWNGNTWVQRGDDIDAEVSTDFINSVSLSNDGNTVAIGAKRNDGNDPANTGINGDNVGHVRIFQWDGNGWIQRGDDIDGDSIGEQSGHSISLASDGNSVVIASLIMDRATLGPMQDVFGLLLGMKATQAGFNAEVLSKEALASLTPPTFPHPATATFSPLITAAASKRMNGMKRTLTGSNVAQIYHPL